MPGGHRSLPAGSRRGLCLRCAAGRVARHGHPQPPAFSRIGRRYLDKPPQSAEALAQLAALPAGAAQALREYLHGDYLMLYTVETRAMVTLLSIRHHRELSFQFSLAVGRLIGAPRTWLTGPRVRPTPASGRRRAVPERAAWASSTFSATLCGSDPLLRSCHGHHHQADPKASQPAQARAEPHSVQSGGSGVDRFVAAAAAHADRVVAEGAGAPAAVVDRRRCSAWPARPPTWA